MPRRRPPPSPPASPPPRRAHADTKAHPSPSDDAEDEVKRARAVLKAGPRDAVLALFREYQQRQADRRWGLPNPLNELLGPLRIRAVATLKGPPGPGGAYHEAALPILWRAARPGDLPPLTSLLVARGGDVSHELLRAIDKALEDHVVLHPELLAALDALLQPGRPRHTIQWVAQTLAGYEVAEAEAMLLRAAERLDPWARAHVLAHLVWRDAARHRGKAEALLAELTAEPPDDDGGFYARSRLMEALADAPPREAAQDPGGAAWLARFDASPDGVCASLLDDPGAPPTRTRPALLARLADAAPARRRALLLALARVPAATHAYFRAVWPLTRDPDEATAALAVTACAAASPEQGLSRLVTRLRDAVRAGDVAAARPLLRGLLPHALHVPDEVLRGALALPCPVTRALSLDALAQRGDGR